MFLDVFAILLQLLIKGAQVWTQYTFSSREHLSWIASYSY